MSEKLGGKSVLMRQLSWQILQFRLERQLNGITIRHSLLQRHCQLVKTFRQEAEMFEVMLTDFAAELPHICVQLLSKQARAYFWNGDYDEAEVTVLRGSRELFAVYGEKGGLVHFEYEFAWNVTTLLNLYLSKAMLAYSDGGLKSSKVMFVTLNTMFSVSNLSGVSDGVCIPALKPQFRQKDVARSAVLKALLTNSVEQFREAINSWSVDLQGFMSSVTCTGNPMVDSQELKLQAKEWTRSYIRSKAALTRVNTTLCDNPGCIQEKELAAKPSRCSRCKAAFYCSRDCHVAHRKVHKHSCPKMTE